MLHLLSFYNNQSNQRCQRFKADADESNTKIKVIKYNFKFPCTDINNLFKFTVEINILKNCGDSSSALKIYFIPETLFVDFKM